MSFFNIVAATNEDTVVATYEPSKVRSDSYQSEAELEKEFIRLLCEQGYTYLPLHTEDELIANLRSQLEELNHYQFSDTEWRQFFSDVIANPNEHIPEKTRKIQEDNVQVLHRDDGSSKNITLIDKKNIHNNRLQVINQYEVKQADGARHDNRYDVTILVNGFPLVHVELKRRGVAIREAFKDWIWRDPERRQALVRQYNEEMNATHPREYDGSHIVFGGMNPAITLREHQKSAIAHVLYGGNTLLAHEVGAGKTFEMVGAAMEAKRLGLCQKSLFVVPNHLTEQWASEFLRLYPSANILVTTKKDFEKHNRKKFCARIATGDYDAIIMGHSQFEKIPISVERQERLLHEQIWEITEGIAEVEASGGERFTVKQLERTKKSLEARLEKLQAEGRKDDVVTFEQLGVDRLFVDEAHNYKNLFLYTKMRNVAGLSTTDAQKSSDMFASAATWTRSPAAGASSLPPAHRSATP